MRQVVVAIETTGLDLSAGHRIVEIGCVELVNEEFTRHSAPNSGINAQVTFAECFKNGLLRRLKIDDERCFVSHRQFMNAAKAQEYPPRGGILARFVLHVRETEIFLP